MTMPAKHSIIFSLMKQDRCLSHTHSQRHALRATSFCLAIRSNSSSRRKDHIPKAAMLPRSRIYSKVIPPCPKAKEYFLPLHAGCIPTLHASHQRSFMKNV